MRASSIGNLTCSVARTIDLVGDPWTLLIVRELFLGSRRFDDFEAYTGVSPHLLSVRLRKLVNAGVVQRTAYQRRPQRHEYRLTEKGLDLWPILVAFKGWSEKWSDWPNGPPLTMRHKDCGRRTSPRLICSACDEPLGPRDVEIKMSTAMTRERSEMATRSDLTARLSSRTDLKSRDR